ncbi:MAG: Bug family tripartite tricarboxylate transporter substrate binding protein [Xanthobacteraceae bacterium]
MNDRTHSIRIAVCAAALAVLATGARAQDDVAAFYKGKTVQMVVATAPGGGVDLIGRLVARHLGRHIPGRPNMVVQNMPGAGGLLMANHLFNLSARDGAVIGGSLNGMPAPPLMTPKVARFDPTKFIWIGSMYRANNVAYVWHTAPVQSLEELKTKELLIGTSGPGSGSNDLSILSREVFGLKYKQVRGYRSSSAINIAMERGEIHAQIVGWDSIHAQKPAWIRDKLIKFIGHFSLEDPPELRPFPRIADLAKTEADKQAVRLVLARQAHGRPYFVPPGVPAVRAQALRRAFDATMKDPAFLAEAKTMKIGVEPMTGEEVQALVAQVFSSTAPAVVERVRKMMAAP